MLWEGRTTWESETIDLSPIKFSDVDGFVSIGKNFQGVVNVIEIQSYPDMIIGAINTDNGNGKLRFYYF